MVGIGGFIVGYVLGARAGKQGLAELVEAWEVIRQSREFQMALAGASAFGSNWMRRNLGKGEDYGAMLSDLVSQVADLIQRRGDLRVVS